MKHLYLVGNWKSNKTLKEAKEFFQEYQVPKISADVEVIICPPFPFLFALDTSVELGAQDVSPYPFGAYTGSVTAGMIARVCKYVIVGHSERRKYHGETNADVALKVRNALDANMIPIVCIDEPYMENQLTFFSEDELQKMIVAYEPLSAIGSGTPDTSLHANQIAKRIHELAGVNVPVLYGGSVTPDSVKHYVNEECISGVLVGGASLQPESWSALVNAALS